METTTASKLLDFTQRLDIELLDNVVVAMYNSSGEQQVDYENFNLLNLQ